MRYNLEMLAFAAKRALDLKAEAGLREDRTTIAADTLSHFGFNPEDFDLKSQKRTIAIAMGQLIHTKAEMEALAAKAESLNQPAY